VWGDITATALSTEEGAFIDGKISMVTKDATNATQEVVAAPTEVSTPVIESPAPAAEPDFLPTDDAPSDTDTSSDDSAIG
jgi:hypothetical protein